MIMAVYFWVWVTESQLLGTYLPQTGVKDKWIVVPRKMHSINAVFLDITITLRKSSREWHFFGENGLKFSADSQRRHWPSKMSRPLD